MPFNNQQPSPRNEAYDAPARTPVLGSPNAGIYPRIVQLALSADFPAVRPLSGLSPAPPAPPSPYEARDMAK